MHFSLFFFLQYYEMSYGLNIEMHKQVCDLLGPHILFIVSCTGFHLWLFLLYKTNSSGQKDDNDMEGFLQILQQVRAQKHASVQFV